jgi:tight adherence protein C
MTAIASWLVVGSALGLVGGIYRVMLDRPSLPVGGLSDAVAPSPRRRRRQGRRLPLTHGSRASRRRRAAVDAEIPQLLDLLAAGSSAGLAAPMALRRACDGLAGPLADEVRATVRAVDLGARWRGELDALADRLDLPDLRRTVAALTRTESLGASLAQSTAELAASVRQARRAATAERARTAPVKMLFPLVFLVLPAFLLLTVVPVLLTTVRSIG